MTRKIALYAFAVVVLMAATAVAALANEQHGMETYGPADSSMSNDVGTSGSQQADAWELREAMETGALPGQPVALSDRHPGPNADEQTVEAGGIPFRPDIDAGP
jgi:hypothetical protein